MTGNQEDKLSSYYEVKSVNEKNQATWTANTVYAATHTLFLGKITLIEQNRDAQLATSTGLTAEKAQKRLVLTDKVGFIINRIQSFANTTGNSDLLDSVKFTASDLKGARDTNLIGIANVIVGKANANVTALIPYGVTAVLITELQTAITAYSATLTKPSLAISQSKVATENLTKLFKEVDDILTKRMDLDIEMFKATKPDFYSQYKTARIVVSKSGKTTMFMANVKDAVSGEPLKNATFTISQQTEGLMKSASTNGKSSVAPMIKKSADKGNLRVPTLTDGAYIVTVEKPGYGKQQFTIDVMKGETTSLKVELVKG